MTRQDKSSLDDTILELAAAGYQAQLDRINAAIGEIQARLGKRGPGRPKAATIFTQDPPSRRRTLSAARKRIGAAQKARWRAFHKARGEPAKAQQVKTKKKRKLSAAGRKAIIAANKRRWTALKAARTQESVA